MKWKPMVIQQKQINFKYTTPKSKNREIKNWPHISRTLRDNCMPHKDHSKQNRNKLNYMAVS